MVSADSLNLDVLEVIFAHLIGADLAAVALVSKSFLAGAIPRLYRTLYFRIHNAKRYPGVSTSFATLLAHPDLAIHVRGIDIRVAPLTNDKVHPEFIDECTRALELCDNLRSFVCTLSSMNAILPMLHGKDRLRDIRVNSRFTTNQATSLAKIRKIERLALDFGSWEVMDVLPKWTQVIHKSLLSLTLFMSNDLNFVVLESTLQQLPRLQELHIIGCPNIDHSKVFRLVSHIPLLESLAFTVIETAQPPALPSPSPSLSNLRHLALDVRTGLTGSISSAATSLTILNSLKASFPTLASVALRLPEMTAEASHLLVAKLLEDHYSTLQRLVFVDCAVETKTIAEVCEECDQLETLSLQLPMMEIMSFAVALSNSASLRTIIDGDAHIAHGLRPSLNHKNVLLLMQRVPTLTRILGDKRIWTSRRDSRGGVRVMLERQFSGRSVHWFMPSH